MGERNDLIMELTEIAQDRHGAKNTHLLSWLEKGYFHCQHGSEEWCQGDYLDSARAYIERLEAVAKDALTTIASLSEALAEAEKKGAEAHEALTAAQSRLTAIFAIETHSLHVGYDEGSGGGNFVYADVIRTDDPAFVAARDLSQGGQHG